MGWAVTIAIVLVIMSVGGVMAYIIGQKQQQRDRLVSVITRSHGSQVKEDGKDKQLAKQRADIAKKLKEASHESEKKKDKTTIKELMQQAGIEAPASRFWLWSLVFALVVVACVKLFTAWPTIAIVFITITAFLGIPKMFLRRKADRRQRKFLEEFPDALDASVRLLQAGMPISEAIAMVSREFTGPLKDEMVRMYENQKIGVPLGQAALETARRIPLTEVHMFATALLIQSETGSSLSEVLSNLSAVIRARFKLKRKVKALSSEAKASAAIIAALPVLVSFGLWCVNEKYIGILFHTPLGNFWLCVALGWMGIGIGIMKAMINFKV